jgi:hypothetical protein
MVIWEGVFWDYAPLVQISRQFGICKFSTVVTAKHLDLSFCEVFHFIDDGTDVSGGGLPLLRQYTNKTVSCGHISHGHNVQCLAISFHYSLLGNKNHNA